MIFFPPFVSLTIEGLILMQRDEILASDRCPPDCPHPLQAPKHTKGQNPWDLILSKLRKMKYYHQTLTDNSTSQLQKKHLQGNFIHEDFWEENKIICKW